MSNGLNDLDKHAKKVEHKANYDLEEKPKINWSKVIKLIWKIAEPEIAKLPKYYILVPLTVIWFGGYGAYKTFELVINLFIK